MNTADTARTEIGRGRQDCLFTEIVRIGPHTCQLSIRSGVYRFQCHAVAKVFSATYLCWHEITRIHFSQMQTKEGLAYLNISEKNFQADRDRLVEQLLDFLD